MKHAPVASVLFVLLLASSSRANADERDTWQAVFAGSITVALGGAITWWHGVDKVHEAEDELCAQGAIAPYCDVRTTGTLTAEELERLNRKGEHGETLSYVGAGVAVAGLGVAGIALYKGVVAKPDERGIAIEPTVSPDGAGATMSLRW